MPTPLARARHDAGRIAANCCGIAACAYWLVTPTSNFRDLLPASLGVALAVIGVCAFAGAIVALLARQPWLEIGCLSLSTAVLASHAVALFVAPGLDGAALVAVGMAAANVQRCVDVWWLLRQRVTR